MPRVGRSWILGSAIALTGFVALWVFTRDAPVTLIGDSETLRHGLLVDAYRQLLAGRIPLWTTGRWGGSPLVGDADLGALYPLYYLAYALTPFPHWRALDIAACLHLGMLSAGMVWLGAVLGMRPRIAIATMLLFVLHPTTVVLARSWAEYWAAMAYWPWLFGAAVELSRGADERFAVLAAIALAAEVYAGYPQFALYSGTPALLWIVCAPGPSRTRRVLQAASIGGAAVALAAPQLLPGLAMARDSMRGGPEAEARMAIAGSFALSADSWTKAFRATTVNPLVPCKIGLAAGLLAVAGATQRRFAPLFLLATLVVTAILSTGPNAFYHALQAVPPFGFFVAPVKYFYVTVFALALLAGLGLERALAWPPTLRRLLVAAIVLGSVPALAVVFPRVPAAGLVAVGLVALVPARLLDPSLVGAALGASFCFLLATGAPTVRQPWGANLFGAFRALVDAPPVSLEANPPHARWLALRGGDDLRQVGLNYGALWGIDSFNGIGALAQWRQLDVMEHADPENVVALVRQIGADPLIVLANGKLDAELERAGYREIGPARHDGLRLVTGPDAPAPRYELLENARLVSASEAIAAARAGRALAAGTVLIENDDASTPPRDAAMAGDARGRIAPIETRPGLFRARVTVDRATWLIAREPYYPNWQATIDGKRSPVVPAGGFFLGLRVPAGAHEVRIAYREPGLLAGTAIALVAVALMATLLVRTSRR
jgi:hypothetical protein